MKNIKIALGGLFIALFLGAISCHQKARPASPYQTKIDSIMSKMTLEEKIGQLNLLTSNWDVTGPSITKDYLEQIKAGKVGAIFNAYTAKYTRKLQEIAVDSTRLGIPLLFGYDVIHGHRTIFPVPLAEACSWDLKAIETSARIAATEASAEGIHWTFAPMVDIARDPRWGRVDEGAGEDTWLGVQIAKARVKGFQGDSLGAVNTILACAKHFAAYGAPQAGRDYNTVDMSMRTLREDYLPPYKACVDAGVATVMTAFNELDGVPCTANHYLLTDVLRNTWGFKGFVVTDYTSINELIPHGLATDQKEAAELSINAGVDMDMQSSAFINQLKTLVDEGKVTEQRINESVRRILLMKFELGLFNDPYRYCDEQREKTQELTPAHKAAARKMARESMVLLKNNGVLPLDKTVKNIAVIGPLGDSKPDMIGNWSAAGDRQGSVTLVEGLRNKLGKKSRVTFTKGCEVHGSDKSRFTEAERAARSADVVILAIGESGDMSGEAASRSDIDLPGVQNDLAAAIIKTGKPVVAVLFNGRPLTITRLDSIAPAILEAWFPGIEAGNAIADVLFGDYNPDGKLTMTFPRNVGQVPIFYNHKNTGRPVDPEHPNDKYKSRYLDVDNSPLYPFGFGLSYTDFEFSNLMIAKPVMHIGDTLNVTVDVANIGDYDGEETVQLYVQDVAGSVTRPVKELKGFQKVMIAKGRGKTLTFKLTVADLRFYDINMRYTTEPGEFKVFIGGNSRDVLEGKFRLE